jgi:hypothetical protein
MSPATATQPARNGVPPTSPAPPPAKSPFEKRMQVADLSIKAVGLVLLIVSGWVGVAKFFDDQQAAREERLERHLADLEQRKKEFRVRFYEQQMAHYGAICDAAARLATAGRLADARDDLRAFDTLYWGKLCIVESPEVEAAQRAIHDALAKCADLGCPPPKELHQLCYQLAHACRDDLKRVFEPGIGNLPRQREGPGLPPWILKVPPGKLGAKVFP